MYRLSSLLSLAALFLTLGCGGIESEGTNNTGPPLLLTREHELLRREANGTQRVLLGYPQGTIVRAPVLSPDGKHLAFVLQPPAGRDAEGRLDFGSDLYMANSDGTNVQRLAVHASNGEFLDSPGWLRDGRTLVFAVRGLDGSARPDYRVEALELATMKRRRLFDGAAETALTPDGRVVFVRIGREASINTLEVAALDGGSARTLVPPEALLTALSSPAVSPDGRVVAFVAAGGGGEPPTGVRGNAAMLHPTLQDVWLVAIDGTDLRRLADIAQTRASLTWSQDGRSLYVVGEEATWEIDSSNGMRRKVGVGIPWSQIALAKH
jgi:Tol biopolymer transport system component